MIIKLFGCRGREDEETALTAIRNYRDHPEYPQHERTGKWTGGHAKIGLASFWVWRTSNSWNAELIP